MPKRFTVRLNARAQTTRPMAAAETSGVVGEAVEETGRTAGRSGIMPSRQQAYPARPAKMPIAEAETSEVRVFIRIKMRGAGWEGFRTARLKSRKDYTVVANV